MPAKVFFAPVDDFDNGGLVKEKISALFKEAGFGQIIKEGDFTAVKVHFGEKDNAGFVKPAYVAGVVCEIKNIGAKPFIAETNTIYHGLRENSIDHLNIAFEHGFTQSELGAPLIIADGLLGGDYKDVKINKKYFPSAKIAPAFLECDSLFCISHFKGHMLTGIGGCIKNIGMGCASRVGKLSQHSDVAPVVDSQKCTGCKICVNVCPADAMALVKKKAYLHKDKCIGCGECLIRCKAGAIDVEWDDTEKRVSEKMTEYAYAVLKDKKGRCCYMNFINHITKECDCLATKDDPILLDNIGIMASTDVVAIDKAATELVIKIAGEDIFTREHPRTEWRDHIQYAAKLGLGETEYESVEI